MSDCSSMRKCAGKIFISNKNEVKICQNCDHIFSEILIYFFTFKIENLSLFLKNFGGDFPICSYFRKKKKLYGQIVSDMFSSKYIKIFKEVYNFMSGRIHCGAGPHTARGPRVGRP